jgi:thiol-disulfide isomerase/thioredoxin
VETRDEARLRSMLDGLILAADSIIENGGCSEPVKEYIRLWSYTAVYNNMYSVERNARREGHNLSFDALDITGDVGNSFDCDIAAVFPETTMLICDALRGDSTMAARIEKLYTMYKNSTIRTSVGEAIIESFLKTYNYSADFEGGLNQLTAVVEKYGIDKKYIADYESRRATIKGTPFPADVQLRDAGGNVVDFSTFKGKYVYIDMWASWCAPCCEEIPNIAEMHKKYADKGLVVIGLNVWDKPEAQQKAIETMNMTWLQLADTTRVETAADIYGINGIPQIMLIGKDGVILARDLRGDAIEAAIIDALK